MTHSHFAVNILNCCDNNLERS